MKKSVANHPFIHFPWIEPSSHPNLESKLQSSGWFKHCGLSMIMSRWGVIRAPRFRLKVANHSSVDPLKKYLGVSINGGTPKSSILIAFSLINHPFWGTTIYGNPHLPKEYRSLQTSPTRQDRKRSSGPQVTTPGNFSGCSGHKKYPWLMVNCSNTKTANQRYVNRKSVVSRHLNRTIIYRGMCSKPCLPTRGMAINHESPVFTRAHIYRCNFVTQENIDK